MRIVTVSRMRERYAQMELTFQITYICWFGRVQRMEEKRIPKRVL